MNDRPRYAPGPASGAHLEKDGEKWTLVLVRELRHAPAKVWQALTDPTQLHEWAPFDVDRNMAKAGATVRLTTVGAPKPIISETTVTRAEAGKVLEYKWGEFDLRWELEPFGSGTRLKLWHNIDRRFIAWGAAGWQICFDVMERFLAGDPLGRMVGPPVTKLDGWQRLTEEYATQFGVQNPKWPPQAAQNPGATTNVEEKQ